MKAPAFWFDKPGVLAWLLAPFGHVYGQITARRMAKSGPGANVPVICVGNFTAGGAGKTPTTLLLARVLAERGETPFIVSRGYGGSLAGPVQVQPGQHASLEVGDEPLLLAHAAPTIVARNRLAGVRLAEALGASIILLDDGMQSPAVRKDVVIAVVDGGVGVGNGYCIPAGPLRAPLAAQLSHVDCVLVIGEGAAGEAVAAEAARSGRAVLHGRLTPDPDDIRRLDGPVVAFAGIGRPEKFFETLRGSGVNVVETRAFPDHHVFSEQELSGLDKRADVAGATLVTTEKDHVRLKGAWRDIPMVRVRLELSTGDQQRLMEHLSVRKLSGT